MTKRWLLGAVAAILTCSGCTKQYQEQSWQDTTAQKEQPDVPVGERFVHKYGVEMSKKDWIQRGREGKIILTLSDGSELSQNYIQGVLDGECTITFPHTKTIAKTEWYSQGELIKEVFNYCNGIPMREQSYSADGQWKQTSWYEDGSPRSIENYNHSLLVSGEYKTTENVIESQVLQGKGKRINRDANGDLVSADTIEDGLLIASIEYFSDGKPKAIINYDNNEVSGIKKTFGKNGEPLTIEEWSHGQQHGITSLYRNGLKISDITYVNGRRHGIETKYRDDESIAEEIAWNKDQLHGPSKSYVGNTTKTNWYHEGKQVSKTTFDELNGNHANSAIR